MYDLAVLQPQSDCIELVGLMSRLSHVNDESYGVGGDVMMP